MPRLKRIEDLMFQVEEAPVSVLVRTKSGEKALTVPEKKAIVNINASRVLGIVGRDYRLVTNSQALEWAYQCCRTVFPETKPAEWQVETCDAPGTGGHCFMDLVHNSSVLDFTFVDAKARPDVLGPFIRITNSYNGQRALTFEIGFFRKVCKNGLIMPRSVITFTFIHQQEDIGETIKFKVSIDQLSELKASFGAYMGVLRDFAVLRPYFEAFVYGVFMIDKPKGSEENSGIADDWRALSKHVSRLCDQYAGELGENAYAVLNTLTDFASHPPENRCVHRDRHSFQRLAGSWLINFSQECQAADFKLSEYLVELPRNANGRNPNGVTHRRTFV